MKTTNTYDVAIIGAGIVGLATAWQLLANQPQLKIVLIERETTPGQHQSGNNSGVIHSGIYYKPGSQKATNCFTGYQLLLDFCDQHQIPYRICGKLIAAIKDSELDQLEKLRLRGIENGLNGIVYLSKEEIQQKEPNLQCLKAIWVPQTGVISFPEVVLKLEELLKQKAVTFLYNKTATSIQSKDNCSTIKSSTGDVMAQTVINCAGTYCDQLAGFPRAVRIVPFRGEYWNIKPEKTHLVNHLIYPVPNPDLPFLGVHFTRRINDTVDIGPNAVLAFSKDGYRFRDVRWRQLLKILGYPGFWKLISGYVGIGFKELRRSGSKQQFLKEARQYIPSLSADDLEPGGAGVRAQAVTIDGKLMDDFHIIKQNQVIHVLNAPSPAATSCFAIGKKIAGLIAN